MSTAKTTTTIPTWDADTWTGFFMSSQHPINHHALSQLRIMAYFNTAEIVKHGHYISDSGKYVKPDWNPDIAEQTRFYRKEIKPLHPEKEYETKISVVQTDCLVQARKMIQASNEPVCVLNMANAYTPGGGVGSGAGAQEEHLFRSSDYLRSLLQYDDVGPLYNIKRSTESYPMDKNFGGIFTPNATVFRDCEENGYALLDEPFKVNFIAVAGINHPPLITVDGENQVACHLVPTIRNKMRTIFRIAIDNRQSNLILGALGCGAFANPPKHIAQLFKETIAEDEFRHCFKNIVFAIKGGSKNNNFNTFKAIFSSNRP